MAEDQYAKQNPKDQFRSPDEQDSDEISHPGTTGEMDVEPDHGEESYRGSGRLTGKRAIITGGDSGIGRAVAIAFAREGADVLIAYLPEEEDDARETAQLIEKAGRKAVTVPGDIRDEEHCTTIVERAVSDLGGLDILVSSAVCCSADAARNGCWYNSRLRPSIQPRPRMKAARTGGGASVST